MTNPHTQSSTTIAQTSHSTIETCTWEGKPAIIKRCRNPSDHRTLARWTREVEALKVAGSHDNIALLLSSSALNLTITLRLEPGKSLDQYLNLNLNLNTAHLNHCTLPPTDGSTILHQLAPALSHLHALHLVHDDVKPENIIWDPTAQRAVLVDFGAALINVTVATAAAADDKTFNPSGTPSYVPPEFLCKTSKGPKGDVWALGVVMLFVWGYVRLPDGDWLLPAVWDEGGDVEMRAWLREVRELKEKWCEEWPVLGDMLHEDPGERISSAELVRTLATARMICERRTDADATGSSL